MKKLPLLEETLLIRTDFSDEDAWQAMRVAVATPAPDEDEDFFAALHIVDDPAYRDLDIDEIVELAPEEDSLLILADHKALSDPEMPLLAVYVSAEDEEDEEGEDEEGIGELRVVPPALASLENNISLANMDWEEFVEAADEDGVFRGFRDF
ncbi:DUF6924 domain-containing protein [Streptomyces tendae]